MRSFNLSALAVRERAITLFFIFAAACAGIYAYFHLGRGEDPSFTIKVLTVTTVWPGATAQEMQDLVAEPLEKRLQELRWYDRVETITRPGLALMTLQLLDKTPPKEVAEQFYQARKKLGDEAPKLPQGAIGPFVNDEYSDVSFALYSVEAPGFPLRKLTRVAEEFRQRFLHVPGSTGHTPTLIKSAIPRSWPASKASSYPISRRSREATKIRQPFSFGTMESPHCC